MVKAVKGRHERLRNMRTQERSPQAAGQTGDLGREADAARAGSRLPHVLSPTGKEKSLRDSRWS